MLTNCLVILSPRYYRSIERLSLDGDYPLSTHVAVSKLFEYLEFSGLKFSPLFIVVQVGVGEIAADQRIFIPWSGEPDVIGVHVTMAFSHDELDPSNFFQSQMEMPVVSFNGEVFA